MTRDPKPSDGSAAAGDWLAVAVPWLWERNRAKTLLPARNDPDLAGVDLSTIEQLVAYGYMDGARDGIRLCAVAETLVEPTRRGGRPDAEEGDV